MPLPSVNLSYKYTVIMHTFGPLKPGVTREQVLTVVQRFYGDDIRNAKVAFELSDSDYHHCHVGLYFHKPRKVAAKCCHGPNSLKTLCEETPTRQVNCGTHHVPNNTKKGAWHVIEDYLADPSKIKTCDDGALDFEQDESPYSRENWVEFIRYMNWKMRQPPPGPHCVIRKERTTLRVPSEFAEGYRVRNMICKQTFGTGRISLNLPTQTPSLFA